MTALEAVRRLLELADPFAARYLDLTAELHTLRNLAERCCHDLPAIAAELERAGLNPAVWRIE